jgi:hypothetical protein
LGSITSTGRQYIVLFCWLIIGVACRYIDNPERLDLPWILSSQTLQLA